jgi:hypothetical protein
MQCLTGTDALRVLQNARPDKIIIYDGDATKFWIVDSLQEAQKMLGTRLMPLAGHPGFLEPTSDTPYIVVHTEETGKLLSQASKRGKGLTKAEVYRVITAGYTIPSEILRLAGQPQVGMQPGTLPQIGLQPPYMLVKHNVGLITEETAEEALWPDWKRRLEKGFNEYRLRLRRHELNDWNDLLRLIRDEDWEAIWAAHPGAAQVAWEFTELEKQGKLPTV